MMRKNKLFSSKYDENKDGNLVMLGKKPQKREKSASSTSEKRDSPL